MLMGYAMANTITVYCPRGCNVMDIPAERVSEECVACGARMTADGADVFYHYREELPLQQFEERLYNTARGITDRHH